MARIAPRLIAVTTLALALAGCQRSDTTPAPSAAEPAAAPRGAFKGIDITGAEYARELALSDFDGRRRTLADWKGKVVVVFFGYVQCPDVCPTTMVEIAAAKRQLGPDGERVQGVFVTVDPERDTPEVLKAYTGNFDPSFVALRGSADETKAVAREFKVFYAKVPGRTEGSYTMDHTAGSYVFDRAGRVRLVSRYGAGADALAHDLKLLLAEK
jgi:protein SCO1/2